MLSQNKTSTNTTYIKEQDNNCTDANIGILLKGLTGNRAMFYVEEDPQKIFISYYSTADCGDFSFRLTPDLSPIATLDTGANPMILLQSDNPDDISSLGLTNLKVTLEAYLTDYPKVKVDKNFFISLIDRCDEAYIKEKTDTLDEGDPELDELYQFCGLDLTNDSSSKKKLNLD